MLGSVMSCFGLVFYFWLIITHFMFVTLLIYFIHCNCVHKMFYVYLDFSPLQFLIVPSSFSSHYRSQQWLSNCDTKTRFWGFASCIVSMCLFCSFSSPLPQYDSRWWLSSLLSPMMPQWCHSLLHLCRALISSLCLLFLASSSPPVCARLIRMVWCFICTALDIRSVYSTSLGFCHRYVISRSLKVQRDINLPGVQLFTYNIYYRNQLYTT